MTARLLFAALFLLPAAAFAQPALEEKSLRHDGSARTYLLHSPAKATPGRRAALVVLHGGGGNARKVAEQTRYDRIADREGFLVVYPESEGGHWNDGRGAVVRGSVATADDVGFFRALCDRLVARHGVDPRRIYVTGLSNGGMMTLRLGVEAGDRIAAIAPVIANLPESLARRRPARPLPVLIMNGTADPLVPWSGGHVGFGGTRGGKVISTEATVEYWVRANRGGVRPRVSREHLPDLDRRDDSTVEVIRVQRLSAEVVLYKVHGGGHNFPGSDARAPRLVGPKNGDINGPAVIWAFLSQHSR